MNTSTNPNKSGQVPEGFSSFREFYPFYLSEHSHPVSRLLHVIGSLSVLALLFYAVLSGHYLWLWLLPLVGYGFAWVGHFVFEKNRPATFKYPLYSFMGDWKMLYQVMTGKIGLKPD